MNMMKEVTPAQAYMVGMLYAAFGWRVKAGDSMLRSALVRMASRLSFKKHRDGFSDLKVQSVAVQSCFIKNRSWR